MLSLEYMAGFIDGEGSFGAPPSKKYLPSLNIAITDDRILYEFVDSVRDYIGMDVNGISLIVSNWHKNHRNNYKTTYRLWVGHLALAKFLPLILPYLRIKHKQAEAALCLIDIIPHEYHGGNKGLSPNELDTRKEIADYIKELNSGIKYTIKQPA